jgi:hypothetical protein
MITPRRGARFPDAVEGRPVELITFGEVFPPPILMILGVIMDLWSVRLV